MATLVMAADSPTPVVIVDSNAIVYGAWWLDSAAWRVVLYQSHVGSIRVIVPEVVIREAVGRFRSMLVDQVDDVRRSAKKLGEVSHAEIEIPMLDVDGVCREYEQHLRAALTEAGAECPPLPDVDISDLVDRAIGRTRPFDEKGSGFRDSLLWETVLDTVQGCEGDVFLVSKDSSAFSAKGSVDLHVELVDEVIEKTGRAGPVLCDTPATLLNKLGHSDPALMVLGVAALADHQENLLFQVSAALLGSEIRGGLAAMAGIVDMTVLSLRLVSVTAAGEDADVTLANFEADVDLSLDLFALDATPRKIGQTKAAVTVPMSAAFTKSDNTFSALDIELLTLDQMPLVRREIVATLAIASEPAASVAYQELIARLGSAPTIEMPPGLMDMVREATKLNVEMSPGLMDMVREATKINAPIPPGVMDMVREATRITLPPDLLRTLGDVNTWMRDNPSWRSGRAAEAGDDEDDEGDVEDPPST